MPNVVTLRTLLLSILTLPYSLLLGDAIGLSTLSLFRFASVWIWIVLIAGYLEPSWTTFDGTVFMSCTWNIPGCAIFVDGVWLSWCWTMQIRVAACTWTLPRQEPEGVRARARLLALTVRSFWLLFFCSHSIAVWYWGVLAVEQSCHSHSLLMFICVVLLCLV